MTFDSSVHPRGAGGRFTAAPHSEPTIALATTQDWGTWKEGLKIPTFRRGKKFTEYTRNGTPVRVTAGVIDREARQVFTRGQCIALAVVLADANAGTPVVALNPGTTSLAHALVRLPDGSLLDVDGVHDPEKVAESYDLVDYDKHAFADHADKAEGFAKWSDPPNYEMARIFIGTLTAQVETAVTGISASR